MVAMVQMRIFELHYYCKSVGATRSHCNSQTIFTIDVVNSGIKK